MRGYTLAGVPTLLERWLELVAAGAIASSCELAGPPPRTVRFGLALDPAGTPVDFAIDADSGADVGATAMAKEVTRAQDALRTAFQAKPTLFCMRRPPAGASSSAQTARSALHRPRASARSLRTTPPHAPSALGRCASARDGKPA